MLRHYGRDVPEHLLQKLVAAFSELRSMADEGLISYPYSTREVVAIVKHLQVSNTVHISRKCTTYLEDVGSEILQWIITL